MGIVKLYFIKNLKNHLRRSKNDSKYYQKFFGPFEKIAFLAFSNFTFLSTSQLSVIKMDFLE
jgi:hypothetical protein